MPGLLSFVAAIGCVILTACSFLAPVDEPISVEDVRKILEARYPVQQQWKEGVFQFRGDAKLVELKLPHLREGLFGAKFYRTEIFSGHHDYLNVETAVMARRLEGRLTVFECRSPIFTLPSKDFLEQFRGLRGDQKAIGEEVGKLFEAITYKGSLRDNHLGEGCYTVDLWHHDSMWRRIIVEFDPDGSVRAIELKNRRELQGRAK